MTPSAPAAPAGGSTRTVLIALGTNFIVAVAKSIAALISGSASMVAESAHSWADTGNQVFLLIANRRSLRPADAIRPLGYGREAYVWSLLAAVGLFVVGAAVSIWHGITELLHEPGGHENYLVAYIVLGVSFLLEGTSLLQAFRQLRGEARQFDRDLLEYTLDTSDPTTRAVFAEDSAALVGLLIALAGMGLHQLTGEAAWDAIGSILVGVLLGVVAVILIDRNRRFLTGEPGSTNLRDAAVLRLEQLPDVASVRFIRLEYIGPKQVFLVASVDLVGDDTEANVARRLRALELELEKSPYIIDAVLTVADPGTD
ncbi:cation diffusion facilitator family transporter [Mycolicibacterium mengxianglii]|uniref:cation diffusion facilitator family transporter n=1 Tax=Mycolicibacterium mengxianglii TaxID=2736649 RepID=UPI0018D00728|nr:cation diffusion facilitator family transporter [Mycolicibacterium mengxianglii]